jgi:large exoprotein involved in heme utilization and adhesion
LTVNASQGVELLDTSADGGANGLFTQTSPGSSGKGGDLTINTTTLLMWDGGAIDAFTLGEGDSGNLTVNASQDVQLIGRSYLSTSSDEQSSGKGGDLTINTGSLLVQDGAYITAFTEGERDGGNVTVNASDEVQLLGIDADGSSSRLSTSALPDSSGKAGNVTINTGLLLVQDGAQVSASTSGEGNGGNLTVNASQEVQLLGESPDGQTSSSLASEAYGPGAAGNVSITTGRFIATGGAYASSSTYGAGRGGELTVNASELVELIGKGRFSSGLYRTHLTSLLS